MSLSKIPAQNVSLLDMPNLVMRKILEDFSFCSILQVRKVCRGLRNFIDDSQLPPLTLESLSVQISKVIVMEIEIEEYRPTTVYYVHCEHGCVVEWEKGRKTQSILIKNVDFVNVFCNDLAGILKNANFKILYFPYFIREYVGVEDDDQTSKRKLGFWKKMKARIPFFMKMKQVPKPIDPDEITSEVLNFTQNILKSRIRPFEVEDLYMSVANQNDVMKILPFVNLKTLREVKIVKHVDDDPQTLELDLILPLLESTPSIAIEKFLVTEPIETFLSFEHSYAKFQKLSKDDLWKVKNKLIHSPIPIQFFFIQLEKLEMEDLLEVFGPVSNSGGRSGTLWCYGIPDSKDINVVHLRSDRTIEAIRRTDLDYRPLYRRLGFIIY